MADKFNDIVKLVNQAIVDFNKSMPGVQQDVLDGVLQQVRRLDVDSQDNIKTTVNNLKIIGSIKSKLQSLVLTDDYLKQVQQFVDTYTQIANLQNQYWRAIEETFTPKPLLREIRTQAVTDTVNSLTENGVATNIADELAQILQTAITSGGSYKDLENQLRSTLTDTKDSDGLVSKYARQITTDAVNQYTRQYTLTVASDLNYEWYSYANSLIETSRPFCRAMHTRDYFNISEIPLLLKAEDWIYPDPENNEPITVPLTYTDPKTGTIENVPIYDKTNLPQGMYPTENVDNFLILLGGYNCGHQARPVSAAQVPPWTRYKVKPQPEIEKVQGLAKESGPEVQGATDRYKKKFGYTATPLNYKSYGSIKRKTDVDGGHIEKIKDAVRSTVIVDGPAARQAAFEYAQKDPQVSRVNFQQGDGYMGYKGVLMNIKTENGLFAEVQVNTPYMIYAKELPKDAKFILGEETWNRIHDEIGLDGGLGHHYYEIARVIDPARASPERLKKLQDTIEKSKEYYSHFSSK